MSASLFSKRHYTWLAKFAGEHNLPAQLCIELADALKIDNAQFSRDRFLDAINFNINAPFYTIDAAYLRRSV